MRIRKTRVSRVVSVYDGDTFRADIDTWPKLFGYHIPIRIRGINAPEKNHPDPVQALIGQKAQEHLFKRLINAKEILLIDVERGKYFRLVATVTADGVCLGRELVTLGLAEPYKF